MKYLFDLIDFCKFAWRESNNIERGIFIFIFILIILFSCIIPNLMFILIFIIFCSLIFIYNIVNFNVEMLVGNNICLSLDFNSFGVWSILATILLIGLFIL